MLLYCMTFHKNNNLRILSFPFLQYEFEIQQWQLIFMKVITFMHAIHNISQGGRHDKRRKFQFTIHQQSILSLDKNDTLHLDNQMLFTFQDKSILSQYKVAQDELTPIHESISKKIPWVPLQPAKHEKSREPWRLTSHPRPQKRPPPSLGKQGITGCTYQTTLHDNHNSYYIIQCIKINFPTQGLTHEFIQ